MKCGAEVRKYMKGVLPRNCQYRRPSDGKSKHLRVLVVRFSRFAVCQMLAYSTSSTVSLAFGKNHHNKQAQMCSQLWDWRCSTRRRYVPEAILVGIARVRIGALCKYTTPQPCLFRRSVANACSLASLRALCLMVGSLPSRALVQMSLRGNTSPPMM